MNSKSLIWVGMTLGSVLGGYVPMLWGAGVFSFSSLLFGTAGAILGIWIAFRISR